ncbi:MAG: MTH938/NDUFAF3 family protein [Crocinitomicaceae bacterium]
MKSIVLLVFVALATSCFGQDTSTNAPRITKIKFGEIKINGKKYEKDIVIDNGEVRQRKKGPSKKKKKSIGSTGHTPLTEFEEIPWDCKVLVIGIGMSRRLPVTDGFKAAAKEKGVELILLRTPEAVDYFMENYSDEMNAIFHITC